MKKFLIIGNMNAVCYKEIFPYIKNNKLWMGDGKNIDFTLSDGTIKGVPSRWLTNLTHSKRTEPIDLYKHYNAEEYPKYDNYDAIDVSKVKYIPCDYDGVMGVPISFLDKYCPEQFEIVGCPDADVLPEGWNGMSKEFVDLYYAQGNTGQCQEGKRLACFLTNDGMAKVPYRRILIKRKI